MRVRFEGTPIAGRSFRQVTQKLLDRTQAGVGLRKPWKRANGSLVRGARFAQPKLSTPLVAEVVVDDAQHFRRAERATVFVCGAARNRKTLGIPRVGHHFARTQ